MMVIMEKEGKKQYRTGGAKQSGRTEEMAENVKRNHHSYILRALQTRDQFLSTKSNMTEPKV